MINESKIDIVNKKISEAIKQIELDESVKISFGSCRYNNAYYTTTMTVKTTDDNDITVVKNVYEKMCKNLGFTQNVIGMVFTGLNGEYEIIDIKTRNSKYPIIAKDKNNKQYKYSVAHIKRLIGGDKIINRNANLDKLIK